MTKVRNISYNKFRDKYKIKNVDLVKLGFFTTDDLVGKSKTEVKTKTSARLSKFKIYTPFIFKNPIFFTDFIIPSIFQSFYRRLTGERNVVNKNFIKQYNLRASLVKSFKPKSILEIGTYLGWGASVFKFVAPRAQVFTMNPKVDLDSNNPIKEKDIGIIYKKKGLKINQIWADSTKYEYEKLPKIDIAYIDGNHSYSFVKSDLQNMSAINVKYILIDDYIRKNKCKEYGIVYAPWNESVIKATTDFLNKDKTIKKAYWIENSKLAVLISK